MRNPWLDFDPDVSGFIHPLDAPHVSAYNEAFRGTDHEILPTMWPQPWIGPICAANVLVLAANPGWTSTGEAEELRLRDEHLQNLTGARSMFFLDDGLDLTFNWYRDRLLRSVLSAVGERYTSQVAMRLAVVDLHAYHSVKWRAVPVTLATQRYTFELVNERVAAGALLIVTRAWREWSISVPSLLGHAHVYRTNSSQQARLSEGNLGPQGWEELVRRLGSV